ncbi:MAG TPA: F0F1 ATP synthase subunit gamma [Candidatus Solibacter sp.]|nr:F0F1 ATP synthase subunit gamma [Candidatus Solibacter sp.]
MASLKALRLRRASIQSTRKITSAMKMVAASKLRRAQAAAEAGRPYADRMERMLGALARSMAGQPGAHPLLAGTGKSDTHLIVAISGDRGLCGGFNASVVRATRAMVTELRGQGKQVKIIAVGRKARDMLRRDYASLIVESYEGLMRRGVSFTDAAGIADKIARMFEEGAFDACTIVYNKFVSAMTQQITRRQIIPFAVDIKDEAPDTGGGVYEFEPDMDELLALLLPRNLSVQIFRALLESDASFQGAQMTAMDSATRNAGEMIKKYTIQINRTRQAQITKELIEIISGAEAL